MISPASADNQDDEALKLYRDLLSVENYGVMAALLSYGVRSSGILIRLTLPVFSVALCEQIG